MPGVIHLAMGKAEEASYFLYREPSDFGRAFKLVMVRGTGDDLYFVNVAGEHSTCECLGFLRHGHCKHVTALAASGRL